MSEKFDIFSKIFFRDVGYFVQHLCVLVLRHQMRVSNYFVNSFYSVRGTVEEGKIAWEDVVLKDTWNEQTISLWYREKGPKSIQIEE
jgi:hypothetical protein